ncbi:MAG: hypothetical protein ACI9SY_000602 [Candidatus Paceibacteria bacterium]
MEALLIKIYVVILVVMDSIASQLAEKLLERNRVGVLLRVFAKTEADVEPQIESALTALRKLQALQTGARKTFARIDFLVSSDPNFDDTDCGLTAEKLRESVRSEFSDIDISVYEIKKGDIYAMLLNFGVANHLEDRIPYSLIVSHWAHEHITEANVHALFAAVQNKARVAGLVIPEAADTIRKGRIANTFAIWHNKSLVTVGGFDLRAGKPMQSEVTDDHIVTVGEATYNAAGVEEIIPLLRFTKYFGPSIKVVEASESTHTEQIEKFEAGWHTRHHAKFATKDVRQNYMAKVAGFDLDQISEGLL